MICNCFDVALARNPGLSKGQNPNNFFAHVTVLYVHRGKEKPEVSRFNESTHPFG